MSQYEMLAALMLWIACTCVAACLLGRWLWLGSRGEMERDADGCRHLDTFTAGPSVFCKSCLHRVNE